MNNYYVYMLRCSDDSFYIGITNNIERRLAEHQSGFNLSCYTFKRRPLKLVYQGLFNDVRSAIRWEKQIKRWGRKKKEMLIAGEWEKLSALSLNEMQRRIKFIRQTIYKDVMVRTLEP